MLAESRSALLLTAWIVSSALLTAAPAPRYRMTGKVSNLAPGHQATVHVHGPSNRSTLTRSDGTWEISNLVPGVYSVTVTRKGYTFNPKDLTADVRTQDVHNLNFTAHQAEPPSTGQAGSQPRTITGRVYGLGPGQHAMIHVHGPANRSVSTRSDGTWEVKDLPPGVYTVAATRIGYTFRPVDRTVDTRLRDARNVNFTGRRQ